MKKLITTAMAALALAGPALTTATPAAAQGWHRGWYGGGWRHGDDDAGYAIAGGIVGLALGAALASSAHRDYGPYYGGYYGAYGPGPYAVCSAPRTIWDPYLGRYIVRDYRYAC